MLSLILLTLISFASAQTYLDKCDVYYPTYEMCYSYQYNDFDCFPWQKEKCVILVKSFTICPQFVCPVMLFKLRYLLLSYIIL